MTTARERAKAIENEIFANIGRYTTAKRLSVIESAITAAVTENDALWREAVEKCANRKRPGWVTRDDIICDRILAEVERRKTSS